MVSCEWLRRTELFERLFESQLQDLLSHSTVRSYHERETIFHQGEEAIYLFILIKGIIDLIAKTKEHLDLLASQIEKEGAVFGTASLMEPFHYNVSAHCVKPSEVLVIDAKWLRERMKEDPKLGMEIMSRLAYIYFTRLNALRSGIFDFINKF